MSQKSSNQKSPTAMEEEGTRRGTRQVPHTGEGKERRQPPTQRRRLLQLKVEHHHKDSNESGMSSCRPSSMAEVS